MVRFGRDLITRLLNFCGLENASGLCFSTAPVEPTLEFKVVGSTGDYMVQLLGFSTSHLVAPVLSLSRASVHPVSAVLLLFFPVAPLYRKLSTSVQPVLSTSRFVISLENYTGVWI